MDYDNSPRKKSQCFSLLSEGNQQVLALHSLNAKKIVSLSGSFQKQKIQQQGSSGVQEVDDDDTQLNPIETVMEAPKKQPLLEELKIKDVDFPVRVPLKIELIDDTVLIGSFPASKNKKVKHGIDDKKGKKRSRRKGKNIPKRVSREEKAVDQLQNGKKESENQSEIMYSRKELEALRFTNGVEQQKLRKDHNNIGRKAEFPSTKENTDEHGTYEKKAKRSRRKVKIAKWVLREEAVEVQKESKIQSKIMYTRKELEALRFANGEEQQKLWRDVYDGLGIDVIKEYEDLASCNHHKNIGKKAGSPSTKGMVFWNWNKISVH